MPDAPPSADVFATWRRRFVAIRLALMLAILMAIVALIAAARTFPPLHIVRGIVAWLFGQALVYAGLVLGLRALRRRRFGTAASARMDGLDDVLLHLGGGVGGAFALLLYVPEIAAGAADGVGWLLAGLGAVLLLFAARGALLYVLRA